MQIRRAGLETRPIRPWLNPGENGNSLYFSMGEDSSLNPGRETLPLQGIGVVGHSFCARRSFWSSQGYIYEVHLRGLLLINVIPTAVEGSRLSFSQEKQGRGAASVD